MSRNMPRRLLALSVCLILLLSACTSGELSRGDVLTWTRWNGFDNFLELARQTYPEIEWEYTAYAGANRTGYSWAQMRADDIPDIFITSQIIDKDLAKERLVDLANYDFVNGLSTALLDQVAIDGDIYALPVSNAMYGIYYNKTLMEEHNWELPSNFAELEALCAEIRAAGLEPGYIGMQLTGVPFATVFNLAKTGWFSTLDGVNWERDFLAGNAAAAGKWESTMDHVQKYIDIGMFNADPEDHYDGGVLNSYVGERKAVFCTAMQMLNSTKFENGDEIGTMPFISEDGSKNIYMYSPSSYIGISRRLTEPGNEKKLENDVKLLSLLFLEEGQAAFITEQTPCELSVLSNANLPGDTLIYDAQQAMRAGRTFPQTNIGWENILSDMGQAYKDWIRGENGMDIPGCIARMDELQTAYLNNQDDVYFCESTADFTLEETARLVGKALGSAADADAAMIIVNGVNGRPGFKAGVSGRLYKGLINADVATTVSFGSTRGYNVLTMTGAQAKELAKTGFDPAGDGNVYPYVLVTRGGEALDDNTVYKVAFLLNSFTAEAGETCNAQQGETPLSTIIRTWLEEQGTVSPGGNPWE